MQTVFALLALTGERHLGIWQLWTFPFGLYQGQSIDDMGFYSADDLVDCYFNSSNDFRMQVSIF